jgi:hypothetical protein
VSKDWREGVKRRDPEIAVRKPERLSSLRARMLNETVVSKYFYELVKFVTEFKAFMPPTLKSRPNHDRTERPARNERYSAYKWRSTATEKIVHFKSKH